ncbi:hypothetical protein [Methanoregula sp. PtaB.Bin085]|uniref:hypothetical protein n=1 Tax=Methanoregula sp. PtaB.Bin085 TaxID=1811680 RepID=UPI0009D2343A|nr:hypothetical protein [Methanoregula sp. PtaB.Bin085]OPX62655.1 MAG: hypothetical protein A4E33_02203 [Methanoregula sp. PtaB.Bin085]
MERKYLIFLAATIAVISIYGIVTMQLLVALAGIALIFGILFLVRYIERRPAGSSPESEGEAIVAAALVAMVGTMISQWIVWAAILGVILVSQQSLGRIEKRLDALEQR